MVACRCCRKARTGDLVKEWVGHSNLRTTSLYTHFRDDFRTQVARETGYFRNLKMEEHFSGEWTLDREHGVAHPAKPSEHMKDYTVPLKPMLGCIGVAPPQEQSFRSGYLGPWGGNMDYREFGEGVTLYFGVNHPGALLFLGDGHAAQGAGELTGDALETSMEFTFSVDLIKGKAPNMPRAENADYRMASGIANSLPEAL